MARKYIAFDPKAEVNGYSLLGFFQCLRREEIRPFLDAYGLDELDPDKWYPVQDWLDVLNHVAEERPGQAIFDFVAVGMKVAETTRFPPEFDTLPLTEIFRIGNEDFRTNQHRGGDVGEIVLEVIGPKHVIQKVRTAYPDDFWYGIFYGICRRYLLPGTQFTLYYDEDTPRRDHGGEWTLIHIMWG